MGNEYYSFFNFSGVIAAGAETNHTPLGRWSQLLARSCTQARKNQPQVKDTPDVVAMVVCTHPLSLLARSPLSLLTASLQRRRFITHFEPNPGAKTHRLPV
jgi:hypothetical protein